MDLNIKRKERKALNSSLYSSTHRNARTIKLVSLRVRRITCSFFIYQSLQVFRQESKTPCNRQDYRCYHGLLFYPKLQLSYNRLK